MLKKIISNKTMVVKLTREIKILKDENKKLKDTLMNIQELLC